MSCGLINRAATDFEQEEPWSYVVISARTACVAVRCREKICRCGVVEADTRHVPLKRWDVGTRATWIDPRE